MSTAAQRLEDLLVPVLTKVEQLRPQERSDPLSIEALLVELRRAFPYEGETVQAIGAAIADGIADGSLCNRGEATARFSRVAKPGQLGPDLSVDVVSLEGPALAHTHPQGEVTLGFPSSGSDSGDVAFDGHPPGWVFMPPGSRHTPTVTGGRMDLLYFLPGGAVQWHPE